MDNENKNDKPQTFGPYRPVRQAGELYYTSGQVGINPETKTASTELVIQVDQALVNLGTVLASVGLSYDDVVKTTLYLTDMGDFSAVNEVYVGYFKEPRPARTSIAVAELPRVAGDTSLVFEIEAVAARSKT
jgi:2-iminobutanoate/2-iminopropanoate deaminase